MHVGGKHCIQTLLYVDREWRQVSPIKYYQQSEVNKAIIILSDCRDTRVEFQRLWSWEHAKTNTISVTVNFWFRFRNFIDYVYVALAGGLNIEQNESTHKNLWGEPTETQTAAKVIIYFVYHKIIVLDAWCSAHGVLIRMQCVSQHEAMMVWQPIHRHFPLCSMPTTLYRNNVVNGISIIILNSTWQDRNVCRSACIGNSLMQNELVSVQALHKTPISYWCCIGGGVDECITWLADISASDKHQCAAGKWEPL